MTEPMAGQYPDQVKKALMAALPSDPHDLLTEYDRSLLALDLKRLADFRRNAEWRQ